MRGADGPQHLLDLGILLPVGAVGKLYQGRMAAQRGLRKHRIGDQGVSGGDGGVAPAVDLLKIFFECEAVHTPKR